MEANSHLHAKADLGLLLCWRSLGICNNSENMGEPRTCSASTPANKCESIKKIQHRAQPGWSGWNRNARIPKAEHGTFSAAPSARRDAGVSSPKLAVTTQRFSNLILSTLTFLYPCGRSPTHQHMKLHQAGPALPPPTSPQSLRKKPAVRASLKIIVDHASDGGIPSSCHHL